MSKILVLAASLLMSATAVGADIPLKNADFEEPMTGNRIPGWSRTQHAGVRAYEVVSDTDTFAHGKHSIRMQRTAEQVYGLIMQPVQHADLAGKTIELTAALKTREVGEQGWLMLMTFKHHGTILNQVRSTLITGDTEWTDVVLKADAPKSTTVIELGFMLMDGGTGWADNVRLRTLEPAAPEGVKAAAETPESDKPKSSGKPQIGEAGNKDVKPKAG